MERKRAKPVGHCWCGCGEPTRPNRFWLPGHDQIARMFLEARFKTERGRDGLANLLWSLGFDPTPENSVRLKEMPWEAR